MNDNSTLESFFALAGASAARQMEMVSCQKLLNKLKMGEMDSVFGTAGEVYEESQGTMIEISHDLYQTLESIGQRYCNHCFCLGDHGCCKCGL